MAGSAELEIKCLPGRQAQGLGSRASTGKKSYENSQNKYLNFLFLLMGELSITSPA